MVAMRTGIRLVLVAALASGCATTGLETVPQSDWNKVPAPERAAADKVSDTQIATAQLELQLATRSLARKSMAPAAGKAAGKPAPAADGDPLVRDFESGRRDALARIDLAKQAWEQADLTWRERQVESANAHLTMVRCDREEQRAARIDRYMLGGDQYDTATYRGQLASAQEVWFAAVKKANDARTALMRAGADLTSKKEAYAQLMRTGPASLPSVDGPAPMRLSGMAVHRRGLHVAAQDATYLRSPKR